MGLRSQLALIGLITLALPWAGCQYLRETEEALRQGQQTMLLDTGRSLAALLADRPALFPEAADVPGARTLYAHPVAGTPVLDGFADDWIIPGGAEPVSVGPAAALLTGANARHLFVFVDVSAAGDAAGKYIDLALEPGAPPWRFAPVAPGPLTATQGGDGSTDADATRLQAWWTPTTDGFNLEARVPREMLGERLGVRILGAEGRRLIAATHETGTPGRLAAPSAALGEVLRNYARPGLALTVVDAAGWRLAEAGGVATDRRAEDPTTATRLYRGLLGEAAPPLPRQPATGRVTLPWAEAALTGTPQSVWRRSPDSGQAVVSAATPVRHEGRVIGAVVMKESSAAILTLTNRALARLTSLTLIATLAVAAALLGYATWLSLRISRLSRAADRAIGAGGQIRAGLPSAAAGDELGDLSRSFSRLLGRVQETNEYLRTLGARLSHELRTPLAVVTSSLDNLEGVGLTPEQQDYAGRAREGSRRLQAILNAMSEASRTEQAVTAAEAERFDLAEVAASAAEGYALAYPEREFRLSREVAAAPVTGTPELLVQMLDKLVANAVEFSAAGAEIGIRVATGSGSVTLAVTNPGPTLPDHMRESIFDSLVSVRPDRTASHLGLGLYIARLIAESHGGRISAANLADGSGVIFSVEVPLAAQSDER